MNNIKMSICVYFYPNLKYAENILKKINDNYESDFEIICILDNTYSEILQKIKYYQQIGKNIKIFYKGESEDLLEQVNGEYMFILNSNNWITSLELNNIYDLSKKSDLDILLFQPNFTFEKIGKTENHAFNTNFDLNASFKLPKYVNNLYKVSFLKKFQLKIPIDNNSYDWIYFYFASIFSTSKIIFSDEQIYNKRIFNEYSINELIITDFSFNEILNDNDYEINNKNFFNNMKKLFNFFKTTSAYYDYKYSIVNYMFNLFYNIFNSNILNKIEYFVYLKEFINNTCSGIHSDLVLNLNPNFLKFYRYIICSNSLSEMELRYSYDKLLIKNEKLQSKHEKQEYYTNKFLLGRLDIKNKGSENNKIEIIEISDENAIAQFPPWLKNKEGSGLTVSSTEGSIDINIKCINDGNLDIILRGMDFRDANNNRIPILIDFTKLIINNELIFNENILIHHDNPYIFSKSVKDGDLIHIHAEWVPLTGNSSFDYKLISKKENIINLSLIEDIFSARFDIKNKGTASNSINIIAISDENASKTYPSWLKDEHGQGMTVLSSKGAIDFEIECINTGELEILSRGVDFRDTNNKRIPIYINFSKLIVNDEIIIEKNKIIYHDAPLKFSKNVNNKEKIKIHAEWLPLNNIIKKKFT